MYLIEIKFDICTIGHCQTYYINFGERRTYSFLIATENKIRMHYVLWAQIIKSVLESMQCVSLSSDLVYVCYKSLSHTLYWFWHYGDTYNSFTWKHEIIYILLIPGAWKVEWSHFRFFKFNRFKELHIYIF